MADGDYFARNGNFRNIFPDQGFGICMHLANSLWAVGELNSTVFS